MSMNQYMHMKSQELFLTRINKTLQDVTGEHRELASPRLIKLSRESKLPFWRFFFPFTSRRTIHPSLLTRCERYFAKQLVQFTDS